MHHQSAVADVMPHLLMAPFLCAHIAHGQPQRRQPSHSLALVMMVAMATAMAMMAALVMALAMVACGGGDSGGVGDVCDDGGDGDDAGDNGDDGGDDN
jgi:hypothetical protein